MKKIVKALILGGVIIGIGVILLVVALSLNGWKLKGNINFEMTTYECETDISTLNINVDAGTVRTEFYDGDKITVEIPVAEGFRYTAREANGTFTYTAPKKAWYKFWFLSYDIPDSVIKIPEGTVLNVNVDMDAGGAYLAEGAYGTVNVELDAGAFSCGNITCSTLKVNIDAGAAKIASAVCETFDCEIDAGAVTVERLTAQRTVIDIDAGAITVGFTGTEEDYAVTTRVRAGACNLSNRTNANPDAKTINVDVSAGKVSASFVG